MQTQIDISSGSQIPGGDKLASALELAGAGFHIFPLRSGSKLPKIKNFSVEATTDIARIEAWWAEWPNANIGISTTHGLLAVDVDNKGQKKGDNEILRLEIEGRDFPQTYTQTTPTGGRHLIYSVNEAVRQGVDVLGPGLDIRSRGGYVVGKGSTIGGKAYTGELAPVAKAPQWLVERCGAGSPKVEAHDAKALEQFDPERAAKRAERYLKDEAPLAMEGAGGDDTTYKVACRLREMGCLEPDAVALMADHWNERCSPPWQQGELEAKVANAYRYGQEAIGAKAPEAQFEPIVDEAPTPEAKDWSRPRRLSFIAFKDITVNYSEPGLIHDQLDHGAVSVMYGPSNSGKTFIALDMAFCIAAGRPWRGHPVTQGAAVYVAAESPNSIKRRVEALKKHHGLEGQDIPLFVVPHSVDLFSEGGHTNELIDLIQEIGRQYRQPVQLIVIDTAARAMAGGDENSGRDMGLFIKHIDAIRAGTGGHTMILHHSGKDQAKGARGHSSLKGAVDTEICVNDDRTFHISKQRDRESGAKFAFGLETVQIGTDSRGLPVNSAVLVAVDSFEPIDQKPEGYKPLSRQQLDIFAILEEIIRVHGKPAPAGIPAAPGSPTVAMDAWRSAYRLATKPGTGDKTADKALKRACDRLETNKQIKIFQGYVWLNDWRQAATFGDMSPGSAATIGDNTL